MDPCKVSNNPRQTLTWSVFPQKIGLLPIWQYPKQKKITVILVAGAAKFPKQNSNPPVLLQEVWATSSKPLVPWSNWNQFSMFFLRAFLEPDKQLDSNEQANRLRRIRPKWLSKMMYRIQVSLPFFFGGGNKCNKEVIKITRSFPGKTKELKYHGLSAKVGSTSCFFAVLSWLLNHAGGSRWWIFELNPPSPEGLVV